MKRLAKLFGFLSRALSNMGARFRRTSPVAPATRSTPSAPIPGNRFRDAPQPRPIPLQAKRVETLSNRSYFRDWRGTLWRIRDRGVNAHEFLVGRRGPWYVADDDTGRVRWVI
jgi:hypothetical protein